MCRSLSEEQDEEIGSKRPGHLPVPPRRDPGFFTWIRCWAVLWMREKHPQEILAQKGNRGKRSQGQSVCPGSLHHCLSRKGALSAAASIQVRLCL